MQRTSVLIVGAGPTGLMMACQLSILNIPFIIVEKEATPTTESRALGIQARSLEIFDQMGIAEKFIKEGKPATGLNFLANGKLVQHVPLSGLGTGLTKFPFLLTLEQSRTETFLLDFLKKHNQIIQWNTSVASFTQDEHSVVSVLKDAKGNEKQVESDWIIGADGAHSIVRHTLKIPLEGKTYPQSLFVLDCKIDSPLSYDNLTVATSKSTFAAFFPMTHDRWRIVGEAPTEASRRESISFDDVEHGFLKRLGIRGVLSDPAWISLYKAHHRCVSRFRENRAFLLGDAANIHSPIGAQGMNTGLQDAYNLAWKIAFVCQKKAKPVILDTYNTERLPFAKRLVETTDRLFNFFVSDSIFSILLRQRILPLVVRIGVSRKKTGRIMFNTVSQIGISYHNSPLSQEHELHTFPKTAPKPGDRLPYVPYTDNETQKNIQELITPTKMNLLIFSPTRQDAEQILQAIKPYQESIDVSYIPFSKETKQVYKAFGIKSFGYYLVRPDMYIAYRGVSKETNHLSTYLSHFLEQKN